MSSRFSCNIPEHEDAYIASVDEETLMFLELSSKNNQKQSLSINPMNKDTPPIESNQSPSISNEERLRQDVLKLAKPHTTQAMRDLDELFPLSKRDEFCNGLAQYFFNNRSRPFFNDREDYRHKFDSSEETIQKLKNIDANIKESTFSDFLIKRYNCVPTFGYKIREDRVPPSIFFKFNDSLFDDYQI